MAISISGAKHEAAMLLYQASWTDGKIAEALSVCKLTVFNWRKFHSLAAPDVNNRVKKKINADEAMVLYLDGASDREIAREIGMSQNCILHWRHRNGLAANNLRGRPHRPETKAEAIRMLKRGATLKEVSEACYVGKTTVQKWGVKLKNNKRLRSPDRRPARCRKPLAVSAQIIDRISNALGATLPADIRMGATNEMFLALADGTLREDQIEREAARFVSKAFTECASKFGPLSLDEARGPDGDWTLGEMLHCPEAAAWVEQNGG